MAHSEQKGKVEFANDLMQKVAYSLLPYAARQPVHTAVAKFHEASTGSCDDPDTELLSTLAGRGYREQHSTEVESANRLRVFTLTRYYYDKMHESIGKLDRFI